MNNQSISHVTILLAGTLAACSTVVEDNTGWYDTSDMTASGTAGSETAGSETGASETGDTGMGEALEPGFDAEPAASDEPQARGVDWSRMHWAEPSKDKPERALRGRASVVVVERGE
jgi:hypothetical protein